MIKPKPAKDPVLSQFGPVKDFVSPPRRLWVLRAVGILIGTTTWAATFYVLADSSFERLIGSLLILVGVAAAFTLSITARKWALEAEMELRLRLAVQNRQLEKLAMADDLTGLVNRRYFFELLHKELESHSRFRRPLAVIMIDVDSLKAINDQYGHAAGDEVLANFGRFLLDHTRAGDIPARIGGDEFAVILPGTSKEDAHLLVDRLLRDIGSFGFGDDNGIPLAISASFGVCGYPWGASDVDTMMRKADAAMYVHKLRRRKATPASTRAAP